MLRLRLLLLVAASVLFVSAAWADDVGYVDCASHPDPSQVYAKPRQSQDVVGSVACGERFIILVNGFIFSRVQTSDGKVGFILSSQISFDHSATSIVARAPHAPAAPAPTAQPAVSAQPQPAAALQAQPAPAQPAQATVTPAVAAATPAPSVNSQPDASTASQQPALPAVKPAQPEPAPAPSASAAAPSAASAPAAAPATASNSNDQPPAPAAVLPTPPPPADAQPAAAQVQPTPTMLTPPPPASASTQPAPAPAAQPEPTPAQPEVAPVRDASARSSWERPIPGAHRVTLLEFFGGFSFARFNTGAGYAANNMIGSLGSFGVNLTSWLQVTGDTSYNFVTVSGTKNVLYGNHFGARVYYRKANRRWGITPFGEGLVGGSRLDTSGGGSSTSTNCLSYKVGGGVDMRAGRRWEIRVIDFDYYRTAFGTNLHQNNYWVSAGVVLRLFGGSTE